MLLLMLLAAAGPVKLASPGLALVGVDAAKGAYFFREARRVDGL